MRKLMTNVAIIQTSGTKRSLDCESGLPCLSCCNSSPAPRKSPYRSPYRRQKPESTEYLSCFVLFTALILSSSCDSFRDVAAGCSSNCIAFYSLISSDSFRANLVPLQASNAGTCTVLSSADEHLATSEEIPRRRQVAVSTPEQLIGGNIVE